MCDTIGIQAELPELNRSKHKNYADYYTENIIQRVAEHFKSDIDLFKYNFPHSIPLMNKRMTHFQTSPSASAPSVLAHKHEYHILGELVLEELSPLQRILLSADGTLTKLLEVYLGETMQIVKLLEDVFPATAPVEALALEAGNNIIERKILLQGKLSRRKWMYADSIIVLDRISQTFQAQLLHSHVPIGKLWLEHKVETFKELITARRENAGDLAEHFDIESDASLLSRSYRVFCGGIPVMLITEKFPESYFA
jgi:chorismate-pyruvate lyase